MVPNTNEVIYKFCAPKTAACTRSSSGEWKLFGCDRAQLFGNDSMEVGEYTFEREWGFEPVDTLITIREGDKVICKYYTPLTSAKLLSWLPQNGKIFDPNRVRLLGNGSLEAGEYTFEPLGLVDTLIIIHEGDKVIHRFRAPKTDAELLNVLQNGKLFDHDQVQVLGSAWQCFLEGMRIQL